jgi:hypothetical protein
LLKKMTCGLTHFLGSFEYIGLGFSCEFRLMATS